MRLQLISLGVIAAVLMGGAVVANADDGGWRLATDTLFYSDTDNVVIVSPQFAVRHSTDEDGGIVGARVVVDVVSAASVDVVSQATNRFSEVRTEADLSLSKAMGEYLPSLSYTYSYEPDYQSHGFGIGVQRRLGGADTTVRLGYNLSLDTVGYTGTPVNAFSESLTSHTLAATVTQNLNTTALVRFVYTLSVQEGYMEKPYRFVPLFDQAGIDRASSDGVPLNLSTFDRYRLALRPAEEVPDERIGHALAVRFMSYANWLPGSIRLDYQFFSDTWGVQSHMLEPSLAWKKSEHQLVSAYARLYLQDAADFWRREYVVMPGEVPRYRTLDRDLSNYVTVAGGARFKWHSGALSAYVDAGGMETVYNDYLFLESRFALVLQAGARLQL